MRLVVRVAVISAVFTCFLIGFVLHQVFWKPVSQEDVEDEAARRLLEALSDNSPANEGLNDIPSNPQPITLNIAVILVVSLLTVSLLITGICCIIVVAVTMDPASSEEPELFDTFPHSFGDSFDDTFGLDFSDDDINERPEKRPWNPVGYKYYLD
uniref:Transmembrane protein n=1 Tax=Panagrellus redivivus TaxID=6233 RepID=A0A7E4V8B9_PANRE